MLNSILKVKNFLDALLMIYFAFIQFFCAFVMIDAICSGAYWKKYLRIAINFFCNCHLNINTNIYNITNITQKIQIIQSSN